MRPIYNSHPLLLFLACFLLLVSACSRMPEGDAGNGERWFRLNRCNGCHGEKGSGGKGIGAKGPVLADLSLSYRQFLAKLRSPNSGIMPAFDAGKLPDQDAADIYLWLLQQK